MKTGYFGDWCLEKWTLVPHQDRPWSICDGRQDITHKSAAACADGQAHVFGGVAAVCSGIYGTFTSRTTFPPIPPGAQITGPVGVQIDAAMVAGALEFDHLHVRQRARIVVDTVGRLAHTAFARS